MAEKAAYQLEQEIAELKKENAWLRGEVERLRKVNSDLEKCRAGWKAQDDALRAQLLKARMEYAGKEQALEEMRKEMMRHDAGGSQDAGENV